MNDDSMFVIKNPYTNKIASFSLLHNVAYGENSSFDFFSTKIESSVSDFLVNLVAKIPPGFFHSYEKSFFSLSLKIEGYYDLK